MNKIFALRYSLAHRAVVVVSELCKRRAASGGAVRKSAGFKVSLLAAALAGAWGNAAFALPTGGQVASGQVSIQQPTATTLNVVQQSQQGIVNWQAFGIRVNETVNFIQPSASSVTLNRVVGSDPSAIYGHLNANGQVFLVNPNGVLFAPGASVSVGGIVASTLGISDSDFLAGHDHFSGGGAGAVVNQGNITTAKGGYVALIGPQVDNEGMIQSPQGSVAMGAGGTVDMTLAGNALVSFKVSAATLNAEVINGGAIQASGGQVVLSAQAKDALLRTVVNNTGVIVADSVEDNGGTITLLGGDSGQVLVGGQVSASSRNGLGGTVAMTGQAVTVNPDARISATGGTGGGAILVGGDLHGGSGLLLATTTTVASGATLDASATGQGNGGQVDVVSDIGNASSVTTVHGSLIADGGPAGGNGGSIETSGALLDTSGITVHAAATNGAAGQWLLDPTMVEVSNTDSGTNSSTSGGTTTISGTTTSYVSAATIESALNNDTNVAVQTSGLTNGGAFDVWVISPIQKSAGSGSATLTLQAANSVYVGAPISCTSGTLNVNLFAGNNGGSLTGHGAVLLASDITTNGGNLNFGTNQSYGGALAGGDVYVNSQLNPLGSAPATSQLITLDTTSATGSGGAVNIYGQTVIANPAGLTINTAHTGASGSDGNVYFAGTVDSGNTFQLVSGSYTWYQAISGAASGTGANVGDTYLATVQTSLLNAVASFTSNYSASWLGGERLVANTLTGTPNASDTTSLDNTWYWVTGPLGLVVNPSSPTGYGTAFFTQNGSATSSGLGGSAIGSSYVNWNPGTPEPNNYGGANLTPSGAGEWTMQFVGTAGQWNDLNPTINHLPYIKETNLAAAPLTVNSGTGTITLGAGVGTNAPLESFNATGNVIDLPQSPSINTTNGTNINGQAQVWNGSAYVATTLLSVAAIDQSQTYGATPPSSLQVEYTVQGQTASTTPPTNVSAASVSWSSTPSSASDVGIYQAAVSGASWTGSGQNPYTFLYVNGALTINPALLTVSGVSAVDRSYNGNTTIALTGTPSLSGLMNGDVGAATGTLSGTVPNANVQWVSGVAQAQDVTTNFSFSLSSGKASNYTFAQPSLTATISPASVTVSGLAPVNRNYDGMTTIALSGTPGFTGVATGESLTIANQSTGGIAASANVGTQAVTAQLQLGNAASGTGLASNYVLNTQPTLSDVTISPAPVTITGGLTPVDRNYDGTATVALSGTPSFSGLVSGQHLTIGNMNSGGTAGGSDVGTHAVTAGVQLADGTGGLASNYVLSAQPTLGSVVIDPAVLSVIGTIASPKVYDGTSSVVVQGSQLVGVVPGDQIDLVTSASIDPLAIGAAVPVTFADSLTGTGVTNYTLIQPQGVTVTVYPQEANVSAPVQAGGSALAATTSSVATSTVAVPPLVVSGPSAVNTSITVVNGGVNAPASELHLDGFNQTLVSSPAGTLNAPANSSGSVYPGGA